MIWDFLLFFPIYSAYSPRCGGRLFTPVWGPPVHPPCSPPPVHLPPFASQGSSKVCEGHERLLGEGEEEVVWQCRHDWRLFPSFGGGYGGTGSELCGQRDG